MTRLTLTETLRQSAERHRAIADTWTHRRPHGTPTNPLRTPACNTTKCPKCLLLALADECDRHADNTEREELSK